MKSVNSDALMKKFRRTTKSSCKPPGDVGHLGHDLGISSAAEKLAQAVAFGFERKRLVGPERKPADVFVPELRRIDPRCEWRSTCAPSSCAVTVAPFAACATHRPRSKTRRRPAGREPPTDDSASFVTIRLKVSTSALPVRNFRAGEVLSGHANNRVIMKGAVNKLRAGFGRADQETTGMSTKWTPNCANDIPGKSSSRNRRRGTGAAAAVFGGDGRLRRTWDALLQTCWCERASAGLRIVDRDFVEASNLQRQTLFEEADARETAAESRGCRAPPARASIPM